jgi:hypothetical protein
VISFHSSHDFTKCGDFRETGVKSGLTTENFLIFPECIDFTGGEAKIFQNSRQVIRER